MRARYVVVGLILLAIYNVIFVVIWLRHNGG